MLVVVGGAEQRPGIARSRRGEVLEARMTESPVDLIEEPVRQQDQRWKRNNESDDGIVALRQRCIDKTDRIVAPHRRGNAAVMQQVVFIEQLGVQQPMGEIKPRIEKHHAKQEERHGRPPAEVPWRKQRPSLILDEEAYRHRRAGYEDGGHALADLDRLALLPSPPLLDAAFRIAVV